MFVCDYNGCGYATLRASYMKAHKRSHVGLKVHACRIVPRFFAVSITSLRTMRECTGYYLDA